MPKVGQDHVLALHQKCCRVTDCRGQRPNWARETSWRTRNRAVLGTPSSADSMKVAVSGHSITTKREYQYVIDILIVGKVYMYS
jgi:hypothetical protein